MSMRLAILLSMSLMSSNVLADEEPPSEALPAPREAEPETPSSPEFALPQFEQHAALHHPRLFAAAAGVTEAAGRATQAGLYPNPQFSGGASQLGGIDTQLPFTLSQTFVTAGKLTLSQEAALKEVRQAELRYQQAHFEILTQVRRAFYAALIGQQRVETLVQLAELLTRSRDLAEQRRESGQGTEADVLLLEVELQQTEAGLDNARAIQDGLLRELAAATGKGLDLAGVRLVGKLGVVIRFPGYEELLHALPTVNPSAEIARTEIDRRQILLRRAEVEPIPDVTVTAGYQHTTNPEDTQHQAVLTMQLPIPVWNRNEGNRAAAAAAIHQAAADYGAVRFDLQGQLGGSWGRFQAGEAQVRRYVKKLVPAARRSVELARQGYQAGQFDLLRLLAAQRNLVQGYLGYLDAQNQRWLAAAEVAGLLQMKQFP